MLVGKLWPSYQAGEETGKPVSYEVHSLPREGPKQSDLCKDPESTLCSLILLKEIVLVFQLRASLEAFPHRPSGVRDLGRPCCGWRDALL